MSLPAAIALLRAMYPRADFPEATVRGYAEMLSDLNPAAVLVAVERLIRRSKWLPSVAEIREAIAEDTLKLPSAEEAWDMVRAGTLADAPDEVRAAARASGGRWSLMTSESPEVARAQFVKDYNARRELRVQTEMGAAWPADRTLPPPVGPALVERNGHVEALADAPRQALRPVVWRAIQRRAGRELGPASEVEKQDALEILRAGPLDPSNPADDALYTEAERVLTDLEPDDGGV